jgi:hypothetical protein
MGPARGLLNGTSGYGAVSRFIPKGGQTSPLPASRLKGETPNAPGLCKGSPRSRPSAMGPPTLRRRDDEWAAGWALPNAASVPEGAETFRGLPQR